MIKLNVYEFFRMGSAIRRLKDMDPERTWGEYADDLVSAMNIVDDLQRSTQNPIPLTISQNSLAEYSALLYKLVDTPEDNKIGQQLKMEILKASEVLEPILAEELAVQNIYLVSQKGIYSTRELIDQTELALAKDLRVVLPSQALADLRQSGRCLAFDAPTASAFHVLRAVESLIKEYYVKLSGQPWPHTQRDWGTYIRELGKINNVSRKILDVLTQIKDNYRNPLVHPEDNLNSDEALSLFGIAVSTMSMILEELA